MQIFVTLLAFAAASLHAAPADLTREVAYIRRGFDAQWTEKLPDDSRDSAGISGWIEVPAGVHGRALRIPEIVSGLPRHSFLSLKTHPAEEFTISIPIMSPEDSPREALYFAILGVNWEVYFNGVLLRREMYVQDGQIQKERSLRHILISIPAEARLKRRPASPDVLVLRIAGDPSDVNTGLFRAGPYLAGTHEDLSPLKFETAQLVLIFLYLFVGMFHIFLFILRPKDTYNLLFGLFAVLLFSTNFARTYLCHELIADSRYVLRGEVVALFLLVPTCGGFLNTLLKGRFGRFTLFSLAYTLVLIASALFAPMPFVEDTIKIFFYITLALPIPFFVGRIVVHTVRDARAHASLLRGIVLALWKGVPGNLLIGSLVLGGCAVFDILDNLFWYTGLTLSSYGFFAFVAGTVLILSNRFVSMQDNLTSLNAALEKNVDDLCSANLKITRAAEEYRVLVEGTTDIIFSLDPMWRFVKITQSIQRELGLKAQQIQGTSLVDLVHFSPEQEEMERSLLKDQLAEFAAAKNPLSLKLSLKSSFNAEPRDFLVRLEHMNLEGSDEILGKAQNMVEDSLLKHFVAEKQRFEIGNYILTAEEMTQRLVRNLEKYLDAGEVMMIRISLREMIINAIEHGNLAVTYDEKTKAQAENRYREFIKERQRDPRYRDRKVRIDYLLSPSKVLYRIEDMGSGFDHEAMRKKRAAQVNEDGHEHGRGIMMTEQAFDEIRYNKKGNIVLLTKNCGTVARPGSL